MLTVDYNHFLLTLQIISHTRAKDHFLKQKYKNNFLNIDEPYILNKPLITINFQVSISNIIAN